MKRKKLSLMVTVASMALLFASAGFAKVPPPPVNQTIGMDDTAFGSQTETTCRGCHGDADNKVAVLHHLANQNCLDCHADPTGGTDFPITTDFLQCHTGASPHHTTADALAGVCDGCHNYVNDMTGCDTGTCDDGHVIPTYTPSLVTPEPENGNGPLGSGACDYCHDSGTDGVSGIVVENNKKNHHDTGLTGGNCGWCHQDTGGGNTDEYDIRTCEGCHGFESLHNIALDSDDGGTDLTVGGENPWYSHVGNDDDCWGCHGGFTPASAPGTGPIIPYISSSEVSVMTTGSDSAITLTGAAFTNIVYGVEWSSHVRLTADDGSSVTLTPDTITQGSLTVTIPGTTAPGNYTLQVAKDTLQTVDAASNPVVLSVKPEVVITDVVCFRFLGIMFIAGSGFGEKPVGTDDYINVEEGDRLLNVIFWADNAIWAFDSRCSGTVTVNALFGSATY